MNTKEIATHIAMVLDRSGSMRAIGDDIMGGVNSFISQQREQGAERASMTLVQFDDKDPYEVVYAFRPLAEVPPLTAEVYQPRGLTPLFDAVGRTIHNVANWLAGQPEAERPERIVIAIVTDGQENASREFTLPEVRRMIEEKEKLLGWQFAFLSADLHAVDEAMRMGIIREKTLAFDENTSGVSAAFESLSGKVHGIRYLRKAQMEFLAQDRARQTKESQRA